MNINNTMFNRMRGRSRNFRGRGHNVVNIQRPLNKVSRRESVAFTSNSSSTVQWKEPSTHPNTSTLLRTSTSFRSYSSNETDSRVVLALSEGRGEATCEIGMAVVDVSKPHLILCQISDTHSYVNTLTKINILNPDEILVPLTFVDNHRLLKKLKDQFKDTTITAVARSTFNKITGIQYIKQLCAPEWNSIIIALQHKFYCLAAASALLNYTESVCYVIYADRSLKVEYQESEGFAIIDVTTADKLELVSSLSPTADKRYSSLYGILNFCQTRIGARTLRATILQPPCSVPDIQVRLNCVAELKRSPNMMAALQNTLSKLSNVDQLLSLVTISSDNQENCSDRQLNYVLTLNSVLDAVTALKDLLEESTLSIFREINETLANEKFEFMKRLIKTYIHTDARPAKGQQGVVQRCFAIKPGVNGLLDIVRKSYSERIDDMREYVKSLAERYNMQLTLGNNYKKGYHIVLTLNQHTKRSFKKSDMPPEFMQVERMSSCVTMKTTELINCSVRIDDLLMEILKLNNILVNQLLVEVKTHMGLFYKLCEDIAKLDVLQSLAHASSNLNYTRPEFNSFMELTNSRHPLLDFLGNSEPTPNSILASRDKNLHIITGPNSSGKSIFIRQLILLQVMAQVGCFVPAERAIFKACDRILARVHFNDDMDCNASTFVLEMKEIQYFRTLMTENTLIVIDELCRATDIREGTAIALAICEDLAKTRGYIFLATHYIFVTKIEDIYPNIQNWQMETIQEEKNDNIVMRFTYNLIHGVTATKKYGLYAATTCWKASITDEAARLFNKIQETSVSTGTRKLEPAYKLKYDLEADLRILKSKGILDMVAVNEKLSQYLEDLRGLGYDVDRNLQVSQKSINLENVDLSPIRKDSPNTRDLYDSIARNIDDSMQQDFDNSLVKNFPASDDGFYVHPEVVYSQTDSVTYTENVPTFNERSCRISHQELQNEISNEKFITGNFDQNGQSNGETSSVRVVDSNSAECPRSGLSKHLIAHSKTSSRDTSDFTISLRCDDQTQNFQDVPPSSQGSLHQLNFEAPSIVESTKFGDNFGKSFNKSNPFDVTNIFLTPNAQKCKSSKKLDTPQFNFDLTPKTTFQINFDQNQNFETESIPRCSIPSISTPIELDPDISAAIQELQECSQYFTASDEEWDHPAEYRSAVQSQDVQTQDAGNAASNQRNMNQNQFMYDNQYNQRSDDGSDSAINNEINIIQNPLCQGEYLINQNRNNFELEHYDFLQENVYQNQRNPVQDQSINQGMFESEQNNFWQPNQRSLDQEFKEINLDRRNLDQDERNLGGDRRILNQNQRDFILDDYSHLQNQRKSNVDEKQYRAQNVFKNEQSCNLNKVNQNEASESISNQNENVLNQNGDNSVDELSGERNLCQDDSNSNEDGPNYAGEKHILVHSVHIFDKNNKLVDIQIHPQPKRRTETNNRKLNFESHESEESITYSPLAPREREEDCTSRERSQKRYPTPISEDISVDSANDKKPSPKKNAFEQKSQQPFLQDFENNQTELTKNTQIAEIPKAESRSFSLSVPEKRSSAKGIFETSFESACFPSPDIFASSPRKPIYLSSESSKDTSSNLFPSNSARKPGRKRAFFKTPLKTPEIPNKQIKLQSSTFRPPKPLTKKEILSDYEKQRKKYLETSNDPEAATKNFQRMMNMPNVKQLQHRKYIAKICKTEEGIVVVPAAERIERRKKGPAPLKKKSSADFDKTFFSDKNSDKFEVFLQKRKDDDGLVFQFDKDENADDDIFTQKTQPVEDCMFHVPTPSSKSQTLNTPDGYYKECKSTIKGMLQKYL